MSLKQLNWSHRGVQNLRARNNGTSPEVAEVCVEATCVLHNFLRMKYLGRRMPGMRGAESASLGSITPAIEPSNQGDLLLLLQ